MKKLSIQLSSVVVLLLFLTAHAQSQDTTLARIDTKATLKKSSAANKASISSETNSPETAVAPKFVVPQIKDRKSTDLLDSKVGPNGEDLLIDRKGYYFLDDNGKKVRIDTKGLRDKPKHS